MHLIPLIFFSVILLLIILKRGFDASAYVTLLYVITSAFSVIMFESGMVGGMQSKPSLGATIVYCLLIGVSIWPIYILHPSVTSIRISNGVRRWIKTLVWIFFINFFVYILLRYRDLQYILTYGDFARLRMDIASGIYATNASGPMAILVILSNMISQVSFVSLFLFFYTLTDNTGYSRKISLMALLGSLTMVLQGIMTVNRSQVIYYLIIFGLCIIVFRKHIPRKNRLRFVPLFVPIFAAMVWYFSAVTESRFEDNKSYGYVEGSLVTYIGMPYSNFCYFFDYYNNKSGISTRYLLPATNYFINGYKAGVEREQELTLKTGFNCVVFMTFLGSFIMDSNQVMPFVFMMIYLLLFLWAIKHKRRGRLPFLWFLICFLLMMVPSLGCISYFFNSPYMNMSLLIMIITLVLSDK